MLQKDPLRRISAIDAMSHQWFTVTHAEQCHFEKKILNRIKEFRAPQRLQMEALTFLVNNMGKDIDHKSLRDAFRVLDKHNTGMLNVNEIKEVFKETVGTSEDLDEIFRSIDYDRDGLINYS